MKEKLLCYVCNELFFAATAAASAAAAATVVHTLLCYFTKTYLRSNLKEKGQKCSSANDFNSITIDFALDSVLAIFFTRSVALLA